MGTEELTVEDAKDMWAGTLDTTLPPNTAGIPQERPIAKQVSEAITDLTDTLANVETDISAKLAELCQDNPVLANCTADIQADLGEFVNKLSEKLAEKNEVLEEEANREVQESVKAQLLREEQDRLEQLREEQAMLKAQKEAELAAAEAAAQAAAAAVEPEEVSEDEEEQQVGKPLQIPEPIMENTEVTEVESKPVKKDRKDKK